MSPGSNIWIVLVLVAVIAQTVRNFAQRSIGKHTNLWAATLVRFLYGLPFSALLIGGLSAAAAPLPQLPDFVSSYWTWLGLAVVAQVLGTAWLLMAMSRGSFVIAVALSKTELIQIAVFSVLLLQSPTTVSVLSSMLIVSIGVCLLAASGWSAARIATNLPMLFLGLASGTGFALAALGFRQAGLILLDSYDRDYAPFYAGAFNLFFAQLIQTALLGAWLALRDCPALISIIRQWRGSLGAGFCGALASAAWFTAYVLRPAAEVRTLGMLEVVLSYVVSRRLLLERTSRRELIGIFLICVGVAMTALLQ
jgi:drug/metabolite transporter (DMT)-like permease